MLGCNRAQGYHFSEPVAESTLMEKIAQSTVSMRREGPVPDAAS